jgi:TPR repeat protein
MIEREAFMKIFVDKTLTCPRAPGANSAVHRPWIPSTGRSQFYLGSIFAEGDGVKKDDSKAIEWFTKASAQQNTRAMGMLAALLFSRNQSEQDMIDAYVWSHLAAEYDPIQATTSSRVLIEKYCGAAQEKAAKKLISGWKAKWESMSTE